MVRLKSCMCILNLVQRGPIPPPTYGIFESHFGQLLDANAVYTGTHQHILTADAVSSISRVATIQQRLQDWLRERLYSEGGRTGGGVAQMTEKMMVERAPDAILCLGGDGTIASVAEALTSSTFPQIRSIPIIPVPTGLANGMCSSLGIPRIVVRGEGDGKRIFENVFDAQTTRSVPLWRVTIRDEDRQVYMDMRAIGTIGMGLYPHWIASFQRLLTLGDFMPMLPSLGPRPAMGVAFAREVLTREQRMPVRLEVQRDGGWETIEEDGVQLCVASQFTHQQSLLSLTPQGSFSASTGPYLGVTLANTTASRMRLAHLFMKEGYVGGGSRWSLDIAKTPTHRSMDNILEEDGVRRLDKVVGMRWTNLSDAVNVMVVVDGEPVRLPPGLTLEVSRCSPKEQVNIVV